MLYAVVVLMWVVMWVVMWEVVSVRMHLMHLPS
jgi:hypothetical protein